MIKSTVSVISILVAIFFIFKALNKEKEDYSYVLDKIGFIASVGGDYKFPNECNQEHSASLNGSEVKALKVSEIQSLIGKGLLKCTAEVYIDIPLNVGKVLFEAATIPIRVTIPYELAKAVLSSKDPSKPTRCRDYVEPIVLACPNLLKPYIKQIKLSNVSK